MTASNAASSASLTLGRWRGTDLLPMVWGSVLACWRGLSRGVLRRSFTIGRTRVPLCRKSSWAVDTPRKLYETSPTVAKVLSFIRVVSLPGVKETTRSTRSYKKCKKSFKQNLLPPMCRAQETHQYTVWDIQMKHPQSTTKNAVTNKYYLRL